jgi:type II secretion system protein H
MSRGVLSGLLTFRPRAGFTLIEILVVLVLIAIVSSIVVVSMTGKVRQGQLQDTLDEIAFFDRASRNDAKRGNRALSLVIDLDRQQIQRINPSDIRSSPPSLDLGSAQRNSSRGVRIERIYLDAQREISSGQVVMPLSIQGATPSYAFEINSQQSGKRWLFVAGMTGHSRVFEDVASVKTLLGVARDAKP